MTAPWGDPDSDPLADLARFAALVPLAPCISTSQKVVDVLLRHPKVKAALGDGEAVPEVLTTADLDRVTSAAGLPPVRVAPPRPDLTDQR